MIGQSFTKRTNAARNFLAVVSPLAVLVCSVVLLNPGAQLERGLSTAAAAESRLVAQAAPIARPSIATAGRTFEEGSEGFWLTRAPDEVGVARIAWSAPVAVGDRVVVNFGPYDREILDVVTVEQDVPATTRIDTGIGRTARYIVTGRRLAASHTDLVQLTVDAEGRGLTPLTGGQDRAL
jgi:hypothetical protein